MASATIHIEARLDPELEAALSAFEARTEASPELAQAVVDGFDSLCRLGHDDFDWAFATRTEGRVVVIGLSQLGRELCSAVRADQVDAVIRSVQGAPRARPTARPESQP